MSPTPSDLSGRCPAVVIVNYATADMVMGQMPALLSELDGADEAAVIVVDNRSPGDDLDRLTAFVARSGDDRLVLRASPRNGGFAYGNNEGFEAARALPFEPDAVLLLNPDAEVRPGALAAMYEVLDSHASAGLVGARLENEDGSVWDPAFRFPGARQGFASATGFGALARLWPTTAGPAEGPRRADWVGGAAVLIRWAALEAMGEMDDGYFLYFEEVDYMRRAAALGWETWQTPHALVFHAEGGSTGLAAARAARARMPAYWFRSWRRYHAKNHGAARASAAAALVLLGTAIRVGHRTARRRSADVPERFFADFFRYGVLGLIGEQGDDGTGHPRPEDAA